MPFRLSLSYLLILQWHRPAGVGLSAAGAIKKRLWGFSTVILLCCYYFYSITQTLPLYQEKRGFPEEAPIVLNGSGPLDKTEEEAYTDSGKRVSGY